MQVRVIEPGEFLMPVLKDVCPVCTGPVISRSRSGRNAYGAVFAVWTEYLCVNDPDHLPNDWQPR
jgi:hypothetical protein